MNVVFAVFFNRSQSVVPQQGRRAGPQLPRVSKAWHGCWRHLQKWKNSWVECVTGLTNRRSPFLVSYLLGTLPFSRNFTIFWELPFFLKEFYHFLGTLPFARNFTNIKLAFNRLISSPDPTTTLFKGIAGSGRKVIHVVLRNVDFMTA